MTEAVLIVDDEEGVRRTFAEWLRSDGGGVKVLVAADAEEALVLANEQVIDLAVLDWNLGSGTDGLRLLEDLVEFQPDIVAILVTGFAGQATPLEALRMGVRDYLDKNQDLNRETFLKAVNKQLAKKAEMDANKSDVSFGSQIRSYVFQPYTMVNDHRTELKIPDVQKVMDGNIDPFIEAFLKETGGVKTGATA